MSKTKEQHECPYCHKKAAEFGEMGGFKVMKRPFMDYYSLISFDVYSDSKSAVDVSAINYCPICGRKLVHDEN